MPGVVIADLHVAPGLFGAEVQRAAKIRVGVDVPDVYVLGDFEFALEFDLAGDLHGNDVLIAVLHQQVDRQVVDEAAVGVELAAQLLQPEGRVIGAGEQHIADLVLLQVAHADIETLALGKRDGLDEKAHVGFLDLFAVHDLADPGAQRRHVQSPAADHVESLGKDLLDVAELDIAADDLLEVFLLALFKVDHLFETDILPGGNGPGQIAHGHHRAVERAHRGSGDRVVADPHFLQRLPHADFIGSLGPAALQCDGIGFACIQLQFHGSVVPLEEQDPFVGTLAHSTCHRIGLGRINCRGADR